MAHLLVGDLPESVAVRDGGRTAYVTSNGAWSYTDLAGTARRLATRLAQDGIRSEARLAMVASTTMETLATLSAASLVGATLVPMNLRLRAEDMRFQVDDADVRFAVVDPAYVDVATEAGLLDRPHWIIGDDLPEEDADSLRGARPSAGSVLVQLYTSGTTGRPKGCLLTQAGWLAATSSLAHQLSLRERDVVATPLPFFHVAGLGFALATLAVGGTVVSLPDPSTAAAWTAVAEHGVTVVQTLGSYKSLFASAPASLATLRGVYGSNKWNSVLDGLDPSFEVWTGYGSTELCGFGVGHRRATLEAAPGTIGRPLVGYDVRIVDTGDRPLPFGEIGELVVRGPAVTPGYWHLPEATAEALRGGWFHTGDLMSQDTDGTLRFVDRLKDMVKPGGENVYCIEIETALSRHPAVAACAVIGVPDARWGEAVKAVVVPASAVTAEELDAWCLASLAAYKRPRWYEFVDRLPRNALDKVLKPELRAAHDPARAVRLPERSAT